MKLYLTDLRKAMGGTPTAAKDTPNEEQAIESYENSFKQKPSGVSSGEAVDTQDEAGAPSGTEDTEEEDKLEPKENERTLKSSSATDILKSLSAQVAAMVPRVDPLEEEFLLTKGFSLRDIQNPSFKVNSRIRSEFHSWLCDRLVRDPRDIIGGHK